MWMCSVSAFAQELSDDEETDASGMEALLKKIPKIRIPVLEETPVLDGKLDEAVWENGVVMRIERETYPAKLAKAPVATEGRILIADGAFWVGIRAEDPEPEKIQAPLRDRDGLELDDYVGVSIDPNGKRLKTYEFHVSASGVQADWMRDNVEDKRVREWDADWQAEAKRGEHGFTVEIRIPMHVIQLPNEVDWRLLSLKRHYPREVRHRLAAVAFVLPREEIETAKDEFPVKVIPSVSYAPEWSRDLSGDDWSRTGQPELGVDVEIPLADSWDVSLSVNPNYLEVEEDLTSSSINDPFTTMVPEKRPFFIKSADGFGTPIDLVYTQNLEAPRWGMHGNGSEGSTRVGAFVVDDRELSVIVPGNTGSKRVTFDDEESYASAIRLQQEFGAGMSLGALGTYRSSDNGYLNAVGGVDGYAKLAQNHSFRGQWLFSKTKYPASFAEELYDPPEGLAPEDDFGFPGETGFTEPMLRAPSGQELKDSAGLLSYKYQPRGGFVNVAYRDVGEDFRGDLGYITRVDFRQANLSTGLDYYFSGQEEADVSRLRVSTSVYHMESQAGEEIMRGYELWLNYWGIYQSWVRLGYRNRDRVALRYNQQSLAIDGNSQALPEQQWIVRVESSPVQNLRVTLAGRFGKQIDTDNYRLGDLIELEPEIRWNMGEHWEIFLQNTFRELSTVNGRVFTENYLRLSLVRQLRKGSFIRLTMLNDYVDRNPGAYLYDEVDPLDRDSSLELLFAWKPTELNTFFLGVDGEVSDDDGGDGGASGLDEVSVFLKYSRAFELH